MDRKEKIIACIEDLSAHGLEIGPSFSPICAKAEGFNVDVLDHACASELREKYQLQGVDVSKIEEVDFVWKGQALDELTGANGSYDFIVASHLIEHLPDMVSFLQQCEKMLTPEGILSLVIPDRRYCFDFFRAISSTGDILQAYVEKRTKHTPGTVFDHFANIVDLNGEVSWKKNVKGEFQFHHTMQDAIKMFDLAKSDEYLDVHNWRFTPASFPLIIQDLRKLELINMGIAVSFDTEGCEFFVSLKKNLSLPSVDRMYLIQTLFNEQMGGTA